MSVNLQWHRLQRVSFRSFCLWSLVALSTTLIFYLHYLPLCLWALGRIACFRSGLWWLRIDVSLVMFVDCFEIVLPLCLWALGRIACFRSGLWWLRIDVSFLLFISTSRRNQHLAVSLSVEPNGLLQGVWWLIACGLFVSDESSCFNIYLPMVPRLSPYLSIVRNLGSMFLQTLCQSSDHHAGFFGWAS